mgnify:CR=1 FL=1
MKAEEEHLILFKWLLKHVLRTDKYCDVTLKVEAGKVVFVGKYDKFLKDDLKRDI